MKLKHAESRSDMISLAGIRKIESDSPKTFEKNGVLRGCKLNYIINEFSLNFVVLKHIDRHIPDDQRTRDPTVVFYILFVWRFARFRF